MLSSLRVYGSRSSSLRGRICSQCRAVTSAPRISRSHFGLVSRSAEATTISSRPLIARAGRLAHKTYSQAAGAQYKSSQISEEQYHEAADVAMEALTEYFEELIEDIGDDLRGSDVEYSSGVLTLKLGDDSYVINKQPPNKQIWLSSPKSGPKRYDYDAGKLEWFYSRDGSLLRDLLNTELSALLHRPINVDMGS